ncbi:MAG: DeoR/GlpR family DNA-binding transcription regulator [Ilumatobacteraceae bacterium]
MLARQRQARIVDEVRKRGGVRVSDLTTLFDVSDMTVRRDLEELDRRGLLHKVHGGAVVASNSAEEPGFEAKSLRNTDEKSAIARLAAGLVMPGSAIGITAGTTTFRLAGELESVANLTVVTNSIRVAEILTHKPRPDRTVVLTGGVRTPSDALVGPVAVQTLRNLHLDMVLMGVHGMSERAGFTTPNLMEAETNQAFVQAAQRLIVLADHTKWGVTGLTSIAALGDATTVVTDGGLEPAAFAILDEAVAQVLVADDATTPDAVDPQDRALPG